MKHAMTFLITLLCANSLVAKGGKEIKGYNGLYMGHSFFNPSARELEKIVRDTTIIEHRQYLVRAGGKGGSPDFLWSNKIRRKEGLQFLNTKKIDLVVMTYHSPENSSVEHYCRWFDYAIAKNPETTFMVAIPWPRNLYKASRKQLTYDYRMALAQRLYRNLIMKLREKYPENKILFCPYGLVTYELIDRFNAGKLPGVKYLVNMDRKTRHESETKKEQILNDKIGHPGELVAKLGALLWLQTLYNYDLSTLKIRRLEGLPDIDITEIAATVSRTIEPYNTMYRGK